MEVRELWDLTQWIQKNIVDAKLHKRLAGLHQILNQNIQPNQAKQPFEEQLTQLLTQLRAMPVDRLTRAQLGFLEGLGIAGTLGPRGADHLEEVLRRNPIDPATAAANIAQDVERLNGAINKNNQLVGGLQGTIQPDESLGELDALLRVAFMHDAAITNVVALKKWGTAWYDIGRGLTLATGGAPEDVRVIGAQRGSVILDLATACVVAKLVTLIVQRGLEAALRIQEIRIAGQQVKALKLTNAKLERELLAEAEAEKRDRVEKISKEAVQHCRLKPKDEGDKVVALGNAVKLIVDFLDKGGEVDVVVPAEEQQPQQPVAEQVQISRDELRKAMQEIRGLENKLRLLGYHPGDNDEAGKEDAPPPAA